MALYGMLSYLSSLKCVKMIEYWHPSMSMRLVFSQNQFSFHFHPFFTFIIIFLLIYFHLFSSIVFFSLILLCFNLFVIVICDFLLRLVSFWFFFLFEVIICCQNSWTNKSEKCKLWSIKNWLQLEFLSEMINEILIIDYSNNYVITCTKHSWMLNDFQIENQGQIEDTLS